MTPFLPLRELLTPPPLSKRIFTNQSDLYSSVLYTPLNLTGLDVTRGKDFRPVVL